MSENDVIARPMIHRDSSAPAGPAGKPAEPVETSPRRAPGAS
ncbi:MAG TPA: hypothetical protein VG756_19715 [Pseudonocardiaceae bacterium]|nr:hypothetical protein [Pseudonocardiaceae bacterium]